MHFRSLAAASLLLGCSALAQTGFKTQTYSAPNDRHILATDLTRDGAPDLVLFGGPLYVKINSGSGSFASSISVAGTNADYAAVADFNKDGLPDIVSCKNLDTGKSLLRTFLGRGAGSFEQSDSRTVPATCVGLIAGDVNGDGKPDIVFADSQANGLRTYFGYGTGKFGSPAVQSNLNIGASTDSYITSCGLVSAVGADFKSNGKLDLILFANCSTDSTNAGTLTYAQSDGAGHFTTTRIAQDYRSYAYSMPYVSDVNGDGKPDVVLVDFQTGAHGSFDNNLDFLVNNGSGAFQLLKIFNENSYAADYPSEVFSGAAADFNKDGIYDAVAGFTQPKSCCTPEDVPGIVILNGSSTGTYTESQRWDLTGYPYGTVAADFNRDGRSDIATLTHNESTGATLLHVYLNSPASTSCSVPASPGVHVCAPVAGQTYASPVTVLASAKASSGSVAHMELWIDGKKVGNYSGAQINTKVSLGSGQHRLVAVEVDSNGGVLKSSAIYFNVN